MHQYNEVEEMNRKLYVLQDARIVLDMTAVSVELEILSIRRNIAD